MIFEKESIKNRLLIDANLNSEKFNIYNLDYEYKCKKYYDYEENRKYKINVIDNVLKKFDILSILEENKDIFQLTSYPNMSEDEPNFFNIYAFLKGDLVNSGCDNAENFKYYNSYDIIKIALYKYLSQRDDIEGSFSFHLYRHNFTFYTNESKEAALQLEDAIYNFFDEIDPHLDDFEIKVSFTKETLSLNKFTHTDIVGNEIKIGDIGVGCNGRGSTQGLEVQQILSMTKVFINGNLRPDNFIVLKSIDGRPLKGV
jgi:hypothetical protein